MIVQLTTREIAPYVCKWKMGLLEVYVQYITSWNHRDGTNSLVVNRTIILMDTPFIF